MMKLPWMIISAKACPAMETQLMLRDGLEPLITGGSIAAGPRTDCIGRATLCAPLQTAGGRHANTRVVSHTQT